MLKVASAACSNEMKNLRLSQMVSELHCLIEIGITPGLRRGRSCTLSSKISVSLCGK